MIKINMKEGQTEFNGTLPSLVRESIILTHSIISSILPRLPEKEREAFKESMAMAWISEIGLDALKDWGLLKDFTEMDVSKLNKLLREGGDHEANG